MGDGLNWKSAAKLVRGYARKSFSPVEVTRACFAQIASAEPALNAMCGLHEEEALAAARASEKRWLHREPWGPLDGVPALVKDLLLVKGWATLRGSRTVDPAQSWDHDAPAVARLKESGAVLLGQTTTPEFGC